MIPPTRTAHRRHPAVPRKPRAARGFGGLLVRACAALGVSALLWATAAAAFDVTETLTIDTVASAGGQCQALAQPGGRPDICGGGALIEPTVAWEPFLGTVLSVKPGIAVGNGINTRTPFNLSPWSADLEDTVTDINGRGRDYLLTAWYEQNFDLGFDRSLAVVGGIIDATDYVDANAYANDELNQFMNAAFVNSALITPPSYDYGAAATMELRDLTLRAVYMNVGENDNGRSFSYFAGEVAHAFTNTLGKANVRVLVSGTDAAFIDPSGQRLKQLFGMSVSADQALGGGRGLFARAGWQLTSAAVDYAAELTAGGRLGGAAWGREADVVGLAGGVLFGGNDGIASTLVTEAYYRFAVTPSFGITADLQVMRDDRNTGSVLGAIASLRATASF